MRVTPTSALPALAAAPSPVLAASGSTLLGAVVGFAVVLLVVLVLLRGRRR